MAVRVSLVLRHDKFAKDHFAIAIKFVSGNGRCHAKVNSLSETRATFTRKVYQIPYSPFLSDRANATKSWTQLSISLRSQTSHGVCI